MSIRDAVIVDEDLVQDAIAYRLRASELLSDEDLTKLCSIHASAWKGKRHWPALEDGLTELLHTPRPC